MAKVALLIGVSRYGFDLAPPPALRDDIKRMHDALVQTQQFETVDDLSDRPLLETQTAIEAFFRDRQSDDTILLLLAGYGVLDSDGRLQFLTPETVRDEQGHFTKATTIAASFLQAVMNSSPAKQQVVILDCVFRRTIGDEPVDTENPVDLAGQLGGPGRVLLTASTVTRHAAEPALDVWSYTRYWIDGIETGAAATNDDGILTVEELHNYARWKLSMAAPARQPKRYGSEETANLPLLSIPHYNSARHRYRQLLEKRIAQGSGVETGGTRFLERSLLEEAHLLSVSPEDAAEMEEHTLRPIREYHQRLARYRDLHRQTLMQVPEAEVFGDRVQHELRQIQRSLYLTEGDVAAINVEPYVLSQQRQRNQQQDSLSQYERAFLAACQRQYLPKEQDRQELKHIQQTLKLSDTEVQAAEARIIEHINGLGMSPTKITPASEVEAAAEVAPTVLDITMPPRGDHPSIPPELTRESLLEAVHQATRKAPPQGELVITEPAATEFQPAVTQDMIKEAVAPPTVPDPPPPPRKKRAWLPLLIPLLLLAAAIGTLIATLSSGRFPSLQLGNRTSNPAEAQQHNTWGLLKAQQGNNQEAINEFNQAIDADSTNVSAYGNRGLTHHKMGNLDAAQRDYDQAIERLNEQSQDPQRGAALKPQAALLYSNRSHVRYDRGDFQGALDDANTAVATNPNLAEAHVNLANARLKAAPGENESIDVIREAALRDYTQAINLRSNSSVRATALTNRGNVLLARNDLPAAFRDYNQAVQINPNYAAAYYNRGMASQTLNRRDPAITDFRRAADLYQAQGYPRLQTEALNRIKGLQQSQTTAPPPTQSPQAR